MNGEPNISSADATPILSPDAPTPTGPFPHAIRVGDLVFTSGQAGRNRETGEMGDAAEQVDWALRNIAAILTTAGSSLANVVKVTLFLRDDGLLTEGCFTSLFVERDGVLLTPPASLGLLPAVLRRSLLDAGRAKQAELKIGDLADGFLIGNALRYGCKADVTLMREGHAAVIRIADAGPGIAPQDIARMLEPFTRGEPSRNTETGGAGLGLTLARAIAEQHGGTLTLANRHRPDGKVAGLEATLRLPL